MLNVRATLPTAHALACHKLTWFNTTLHHNIIASEQSGVECACARSSKLRVAYLELRTTLRYVQRPDRHYCERAQMKFARIAKLLLRVFRITQSSARRDRDIYIYIAKNRALDTTRSARSLRSLAIISPLTRLGQLARSARSQLKNV